MNKRPGRISEVLRYRLLYAVDRCLGIAFIFLFLPFKGFSRQPASDFSRILIIKLTLMGDTVLLVPTLRAIREKFPRAKISVIVTQTNSEILKNCPYIDEKIIAPLEKLLNPFYLAGLIKRIRAIKFDLAIDFEQWYRISALISFLSGAKERIGFETARQYRHYLFTRTVLHKKEMHELESFLDLARLLNIESTNKKLELWPQEQNFKEARVYLERLDVNSDFIILHSEVSATGRQRQWPIENFGKLGNIIREKYNLQVLIASSSKGRGEAEELNSLLGNQAGLLIGVPLLTLFVIAGKARIVVTNNTGFMHLAVASGAVVIGLHGPTSSVKWGPWGTRAASIKSRMPCSPCLYLGFEYGCKTDKCMRQIHVDEVLMQVEKALGVNI